MRRLKRRSAATPNLKELELIARLRRDAAILASQFQLSYREIAPEKPRVKRRYGACTVEGKIALRLRHAKTGEHLKYSSLVNTLCHELAHLRHFNHGPRFKALYLDILEFARSSGIYCPGAPRHTVATQLELFRLPDTFRQFR